MQEELAVSRRPVSLLALLVSAVALAGCGTGLEAKTYSETGRQDGAFATVGGRDGVVLQRLHVIGPDSGSTLAAGDTALVTGGLVNNSGTDDALIGASSDLSNRVTLLVDGSPATELALPAHRAAGTWSIVLNGLTREVHVATSITVTLEFQRAGKVTVQVPVAAGDNGLRDRTPQQDPYAEG
jgi:copper(I)-binding protein